MKWRVIGFRKNKGVQDRDQSTAYGQVWARVLDCLRKGKAVQYAENKNEKGYIVVDISVDD